jgi:hypothetical protein
MIQQPRRAGKQVGAFEWKSQNNRTLEKTPKQQHPVYHFQMENEQNKTTRRIVAFDAIATNLARETELAAGEPIRILA